MTKFYNNASIIVVILIIGAVSHQLINDSLMIQPVSAAGVEHAPIYITTDTDFDNLATSEGWSGSGTTNDPYIIENLIINATTVPGFYVHGVSRSFILRNCTIYAEYEAVSIYSTNSAKQIVTNSTLYSESIAVYVKYSGNSEIIIANNTLSAKNYGVSVYATNNVVIGNNTITPVNQGIRIVSSSNSNIGNNTIINSKEYGVYISVSSNSNVTNNIFSNCGLYFYETSESGYKTHTVTGNMVNNKPVLYLIDSSSLELNHVQYGQIWLISSDNVYLENQNFNYNVNAINVLYGSNVTIINSSFVTNVSAITAYKINNLTVINSTFTNSNYNTHEFEINLYYANYFVALNNTFDSIYNGIQSEISSFTQIENNSFSNIYQTAIAGSLYNSSINNNHFSNIGITLEATMYYTNITNNLIYDNGFDGISINDGTDNRIVNNVFSNSSLTIYSNYDSYYVENNTVNGKQLGFFVNVANINIISPDYGQLIIANSLNVSFKNQFFYDVSTAIYAYNVSNLSITDSSMYGIKKIAVNLNTVTNVVIKNFIANMSNISLDSLFFNDVSFLFINNSRFMNAGESDIMFYSVTNATLTFNIIQDSVDEGLYGDSCENISVFNNVFLNNNKDEPDNQVYIESSDNNIWYNNVTKEGNSWSNWNGSSTYTVCECGSTKYIDLYPHNDTDLDHLNDSDEVYLYNSNPFLVDSDGDTISDYDEVILHRTSPILHDTDGDTIPDEWEIQNGLNPLVNDTTLDPDNDGLTNIQEYTFNTNPYNNDTDSDAMPDGWEVNNNLNPLVNDTTLDPDNDSLTNIQEYTLGTDPQVADTDGDSYTDGEEVLAGTDPLDPLDHPANVNIGLIIGLSVGGVAILAGLGFVLWKFLLKNKLKTKV